MAALKLTTSRQSRVTPIKRVIARIVLVSVDVQVRPSLHRCSPRSHWPALASVRPRPHSETMRW
eukprot:12034628-Karenia_brevis.AAC.1